MAEQLRGPHFPEFNRTQPPAPSSAEIGSIPQKGIRGVTQEEAEQLNRRRGEPKKRLPTLTKVGLGGLSVLALGGVAEAVPVVRHATADFINHLRGKSLSSTSTEATTATNPKEVFDNNVLIGEISTRNTEQLTQEEIDELPKVNAEGEPIYLFPFEVEESDNIEFEKQGVEKDGKVLYGDVRIKKLKSNKRIAAWHEGYVFANRSQENGKTREDILLIIFPDSNGDIRRTAVINGSIGSPTFGFDIDNSIPSLSDDNKNGRDYEKGKFVKLGEDLGASAKDLKNVAMQIMKIGKGDYSNPTSRTTEDIVFYTKGDSLAVKALKKVTSVLFSKFKKS